MRKSNATLLLGALALFTGVNLVTAQIRPAISINLSAGANISVTGTPGAVYVIQSTGDFTQTNGWASLSFLQVSSSNHMYVDASPRATASRFYRVLLPAPPTNMVFIPPNTFTLGSPANEDERSSDEGPQTVVTLTHGFWISEFLVTQEDYLAVIGNNPSDFAGDLSRPVESVTWLDATNYCARRTQIDLAVGRIPPGSHYRLPTEAEWECTARAGTTTRFYYGDDPGATMLTNHAWYFLNSGATTQAVGQKAPNPWGLYDMEGNVWEWCQDWYGPYPGGSESDPQGPASSPISEKVIRGGAWDAADSDCRSARRMSEGVSPFISDIVIGFRVVLAIDP